LLCQQGPKAANEVEASLCHLSVSVQLDQQAGLVGEQRLPHQELGRRLRLAGSLTSSVPRGPQQRRLIIACSLAAKSLYLLLPGLQNSTTSSEAPAAGLSSAKPNFRFKVTCNSKQAKQRTQTHTHARKPHHNSSS
jgi:hypothetical protein